MYLYEPPHTRCVSLLLIKTLVDTLDKPKSASYSKSRETSHETALHPIYIYRRVYVVGYYLGVKIVIQQHITWL